MSFFSVENLTAGYGKQPVLEQVSLSLDRGCIMGILGANGCGKTTLLKAICSILPHKGTCSLEGVCLEGLRPRTLAQLCGYVPQRSGLRLDISPLDVVLMGFNPRLNLLEQPGTEMRHAAMQALAAVGLAGKENENYQTLSQGQKQLCILARALVTEGKLLLLDEPESALDFRVRCQVPALLRRWVAERDGCALMALHDPGMALNSCDKLLLLKDGRVLGSLCPASDDPARMEDLLSQLYGSVSVVHAAGRDGRQQLVMLKEVDA